MFKKFYKKTKLKSHISIFTISMGIINFIIF